MIVNSQFQQYEEDSDGPVVPVPLHDRRRSCVPLHHRGSQRDTEVKKNIETNSDLQHVLAFIRLYKVTEQLGQNLPLTLM